MQVHLFNSTTQTVQIGFYPDDPTPLDQPHMQFITLRPGEQVAAWDDDSAGQPAASRIVAEVARTGGVSVQNALQGAVPRAGLIYSTEGEIDLPALYKAYGDAHGGEAEDALRHATWLASVNGR